MGSPGALERHEHAVRVSASELPANGLPGNRVSLLRASVPARLLMAAAAAALLWGAVYWALV